MKKGKKIKTKLADRTTRWDNLPTSDMRAPRTKIVAGVGTAFHKPGSQNLRTHN